MKNNGEKYLSSDIDSTEKTIEGLRVYYLKSDTRHQFPLRSWHFHEGEIELFWDQETKRSRKRNKGKGRRDEKEEGSRG
jgi:hypothetical protein